MIYLGVLHVNFAIQSCWQQLLVSLLVAQRVCLSYRPPHIHSLSIRFVLYVLTLFLLPHYSRRSLYLDVNVCSNNLLYLSSLGAGRFTQLLIDCGKYVGTIFSYTATPYLFTCVSAWLPEVDKHIVAQDGMNLFNTTTALRSKRSLPSGKIRGVNLGALFVLEPWMAWSEWSRIGCSAYASEADCVAGIGQTAANTAFEEHWNSWITQSDIHQMKDYGLNTVRIPVGYWMDESLVYAGSEHFPQGGLQYLDRICGWAADAGLFVVIDLHGAPGAQVADNPDTGQYAPTPGFYADYQYSRALSFLSWMTTNIHSNTNFRTVGVLEIVNEPVQNAGSVGTMLSSYYPNAFSVCP